MGNAASDAAEEAATARVATLRDQLADMERAVRHLSQRPQIDVLLPHQMRVHGAVVSTSPAVRVLLGPVIGKVDASSARVLLELDRAAAVTCHVLIDDQHSDAYVEVPHCRVTIATTAAAKAPTVFPIQSLLPGRHYRVVFSGLSREEAPHRVGSFRTPAIGATAKLKCAFVSADDAYALQYGEPSLWRRLRAAVVDEQRVQLVVHLGGQVSMRRMFDKAWATLVRHAECMDLPVTLASTATVAGNAQGYYQDWESLERVAMEILRSAYRTQWTLQTDKRLVLAHCSNLMMWSDWDVYPAFTTASAFAVDHAQPTLEMQVLRTLVRCARVLYQQYQRALWDDDLEELLVREQDMRTVAEQALATTARVYALSREIPAAQAELETQKKRREIDGARKVERHLRALEAEKAKHDKLLVSYNALLAPQGGEELFYAVGSVGFLLLDLRSARCEPGGSQRADSELLSPAQWAFVEETLENAAIQALFVCSESPLVDDLPHELRAGISEASHEACTCDFRTWWGMNPGAQQRLLALLFEWKLQQPGREVTLVAGACNTRLALRSRVRDGRLRTEIAQWMTGPVTASPSGRAVPSWAGTLFDRYAFEHQDVSTKHRSFLTAEIDAVSVLRWERDGEGEEEEEKAEVLLGPVVGYVDAVSAVVLLEVDRACDLVCVVHNALTGERLCFFQRFEARRPNAFFLNHLRPQHHYTVAIEGIQREGECQGSFTTLAAVPERVCLVGINHSTATESPAIAQRIQQHTLWPWIKDNLASGVPFTGASHVIHFDSILMTARELQDLGPVDARELEERVREAKRDQWNMPGLRELLRRGSHVMVASQQQPATDTSASEYDLLVARTVEAVESEYQNLLLPPSKRVASPTQRVAQPLSFTHGEVGVLVLPRSLYGAEHQDTDLFWLALGQFLKTPLLSTAVVVADAPIIEDSVEDTEEKAKEEPAYQRTLAFHRDTLRRLLETLFEWQAKTRDRRVLSLCGHERRSFESTLQDVYLSRELQGEQAVARGLQQFVVGPLELSLARNAATHTLALNVFPQGSLFERYAYFHRFQRLAPSTTTSEGDGVQSEREGGAADEEGVVQQLLCLQLEWKPGVDDKKLVDVQPTYVSTRRMITASDTEDAAASSRFALAISHADLERWRLAPCHPPWLESLVTQQLTEAEEATLADLKRRLQDKRSEIQASYTRADLLATGVVSAASTAAFVVLLQAAIADFHQHLAGMAFRASFPATPSAYVVNYSLQELQPQPTVGAIDLDTYTALLAKSLANAWLFDTRLRYHYSQ